MKIGIISREYPPLTHVGGIATFSAATAHLLASHGHDVHVICNATEEGITQKDGITVHRVKMLAHHFPSNLLFFPYRKWYRLNLPHYLEALTWARTVQNYFRTKLSPIDFDILEYPETGGEGARLPRVKKETKPRLICRIHSGWMDAYAENKLERALLLKLQKKGCRQATQLVSPSFFMAGDYVKKTLGINSPVAVSRNPISFWQKPVDWETKKMQHLLYVGRVEFRKGLQVLLKALDELGVEGKHLILRVVGQMHPPTRDLDRQCIDYFKSRLAEKSETKHYKIEYHGACPHSEMAKHYDWAGIQVIPSLMENYPYVALEGLSRGCHLLGSNVGGIPEIIDRPSRGSLFSAENSTQLAEKIRECMHREFEISEGKRGMAEEIRSEFDPENCYLRLMETYGADLSQRGTG